MLRKPNSTDGIPTVSDKVIVLTGLLYIVSADVETNGF